MQKVLFVRYKGLSEMIGFLRLHSACSVFIFYKGRPMLIPIFILAFPLLVFAEDNRAIPFSELMNKQELTVGDDLPPIRTTIHEVSLFVDRLEDLVKRSLKPNEGFLQAGNLPISYEIGSEEIKINRNSIDDLLKDPRLPNPAYKFTILKSSYNDSISFQIYFEERYSRYQVTGSDFGLVEAIQKHIDSFGHENEMFLGNMLIPLLFALICFLFALFAPSILAVIIVDEGRKFLSKTGLVKSGFQVSDTGFIFILYLIIVLPTFAYLTSFLYSAKSTWFSNTKIYPKTANILELYGPEISFIAFLITLIAALVSITSYFLRPKIQDSVKNETEKYSDDKQIEDPTSHT